MTRILTLLARLILSPTPVFAYLILGPLNPGTQLIFLDASQRPTGPGRVCASPPDRSGACRELPLSRFLGRVAQVQQPLNPTTWPLKLEDGETVYVTADRLPLLADLKAASDLITREKGSLVGKVIYNNANHPKAAHQFKDLGPILIDLLEPAPLHHLERFEVSDLRMALKGGDLFLIVRSGTRGLAISYSEEGFFSSRDMAPFFKWPKKFQEAIRNRKLLVGMTAQQVLMSIGRPNQIEEIGDEKGVREEWSYKSFGVERKLTFKEGGLIRYRIRYGEKAGKLEGR